MAGHRGSDHPLRGKVPPWVKPKDPNLENLILTRINLRASTWRFIDEKAKAKNLTISELGRQIFEAWQRLWTEETSVDDIPMAPRGLLPDHYYAGDE